MEVLSKPFKASALLAKIEALMKKPEDLPTRMLSPHLEGKPGAAIAAKKLAALAGAPPDRGPACERRQPPL